MFTATPLPIPDVLLIGSRRFADSRGYFTVTHEEDEFREIGLPDFVQDGEAYSARAGTMRGLHFQREPHAQAKLVRAVRGSLFDVAVDIRPGSATFGKWVGATLDARSEQQLFVPRGFAHGYCTLEDDTIAAYKFDGPYAAAADAGILFSDPDIAIAWPIVPAAMIVSDKDRALPKLRVANLSARSTPL